MLSRNIKQEEKTQADDGRLKTLHGISTSCLRFSSKHSPRTPKKDPNANCNQQTDINVKRETNDAKFSGEHKHDRTSTGNHYHGFNSFQAK